MFEALGHSCRERTAAGLSKGRRVQPHSPVKGRYLSGVDGADPVPGQLQSWCLFAHCPGDCGLRKAEVEHFLYLYPALFCREGVRWGCPAVVYGEYLAFGFRVDSPERPSPATGMLFSIDQRLQRSSGDTRYLGYGAQAAALGEQFQQVLAAVFGFYPREAAVCLQAQPALFVVAVRLLARGATTAAYGVARVRAVFLHPGFFSPWNRPEVYEWAAARGPAYGGDSWVHGRQRERDQADRRDGAAAGRPAGWLFQVEVREVGPLAGVFLPLPR